MFLLICLFAAAVFAIFVLIFTSRPRPSEVTWDVGSKDETFENERLDHGNGEAGPPAEQLLGELQQLSDEIAARVQDRLGELSALLDRADEKISELKASVEQPSADAPETSEEGHPPHIPISEKHRTVYDLADSGLDVHEIAERTKIGTGEIELILSLRDRG